MAKRKSSGLEKARAALRKKYGTDNIGEINRMKKKRGAARKPNPTMDRAARRRVQKRAKKAKSNPAPAPAPVVKVETTQMARSNPRKMSAKARRAALRNLKKARRARRRRKNPATKKTKRARARSRTRRSNPSPLANLRKGKRERRVGAKRRRTKKVSVSGYSRKSRVRGHQRYGKNPARGGGGGLMSNQGPFTRARFMNYTVGALAVGVGMLGARAMDRYIATRKPKGGAEPLFGRAAAGAIYLRPDGIRLGAQALGAVGSMALGYVTRRTSIGPWIFGGLAVGFGANLFLQLGEYYLMPMLLKSENGTDKGLGNRLYPGEQKYAQDAATERFKALTNPGVAPVLGAAGSIFMLGNLSERDAEYANQLGAPRFAHDGTIGSAPCDICGGRGGHYTTCRNYCASCEEQADVTLEAGENILSLATLAGVDPNYVSGINGGRALNTFAPGDTVRVPYKLGKYLEDLDAKKPKVPPVQQPFVGPPPSYDDAE